jgi:hypothetical protein
MALLLEIFSGMQRIDMTLPPKRIWSCMALLFLLAVSVSQAFAESPDPIIPAGFALVRSDTGVALYQKNYPGGSPDFVQVVRLDQGAVLKPLITSIADPRQGKGVYGGSDARFRSQSLSAYWGQFSANYPTAFCVANGQFFYMKEYPTRLPFPLKIDGKVVTDGYGIKDFPDQKLMLELWSGRADITPLSKDALYTSTAPDIIAGLTEDAPKQKKRYTGRTFVGLDDLDGNGYYETLLLLTTKTARQIDAAEVLRSFGADKVMMLDGGGSTQLSCQGDSYIYSERILPQTIGILAGPGESAKLAAGAQVAQVVSPSLTEAETLASGQGLSQEALSIQPTAQNQVIQPESLQTDSLPPSPVEEVQPAQPLEMSAQPVQETSQDQQASAQLAAPSNDVDLQQSDTETQAQSPEQPLDDKAAPASAHELVANQVLENNETPAQTSLAASPDNEAGTTHQAPLVLKAQQYLNMVANEFNRPAAQSLQQADQPGNLSTNLATDAVAQSRSTASGQPIQISGVLWVPAGMLPIVLVLLFAVGKTRQARD